MTKIDVDVNCPKDGAKLLVEEVVYRDEDELKDSEVEWQCPNGCLFDEPELSEIDKKVNELVQAFYN